MACRYFENSKDSVKKKGALILTLILDIAFLCLLKYTNMFIGTFNYWSGSDVATVNWIAPLAISYYTLQLVAYLLDCYWGNAKAFDNPLKLLLYTTYFPLMVSGPICRYSQIGESIFEEHRFDYDRVTSGMRRVLWGIAKKVIVADHLSIIVGIMFGDVDTFSGVWVLIAAMVFAVQLYFDFSGCIDIVLGVSKCFGIILPENFNAPFFSKSIQEIWRRWHITLGLWFKDYVMYPIQKSAIFIKLGDWSRAHFGKKRGKKIPAYLAMLILWLCIGLWHGSSWKYVIGQGLYFWIIIVGSQILEPVYKNVRNALHINADSTIWHGFQMVRTFILFAVGNIAFRAESLEQTFYMYRRIFAKSNFINALSKLRIGLSGKYSGKMIFLESIIAVALICIIQISADYMTDKGKTPQKLVMNRKLIVRWAMYFGLIFIILSFQVLEDVEFIYFKF
jgi:D-alanyl-lipoteichoic acid acyltransferase DltB (MBOAT superfamily)